MFYILSVLRLYMALRENTFHLPAATNAITLGEVMCADGKWTKIYPLPHEGGLMFWERDCIETEST